MAIRQLSFLEAEEDAVYEDYEETTKDPGNTLIIVAVIICIFSVIGLPLFVKLGTKCSAKTTPDSDSDTKLPWRKGSLGGLLSVLDNAVRRRKRGANAGEHMNGRMQAVSRGVTREARWSMYLHGRTAKAADDADHADIDLTCGSGENDLSSASGPSSDQMETITSMIHVKSSGLDSKGQSGDNNENDQLETYTQENTTNHPPVGFLRKELHLFWSIVQYDNETKRLLRLAVPFTFSAMAETLSDLIILAIISQYVGTESMVAYAMCNVIVGISSSFMGGWLEAISSLGSHAFGAGNYELVGQYVQIACLGYTLCQIPMLVVWGFSIGHILLLMGFDETVAELAKSFVWVQVAIDIMEGVNECVLDMLEVIEKEAYSNVMYCIGAAVEVGLVMLFASKVDADLVILGLVMVSNSGLFFFLNVLIPNKMGWFKRFEIGLFGRCACRNTAALKDLFRTALPLAFGSLLAYAEWEILTVFAAVLGPAEAATWAILGFVWDVFESTTEAIGDASEVRCAYQLGKGRPALAKLAAYKSMLLGTVVAFVVTAIFLGLHGVLPAALTHDPTIQGMLAELFPLMAMGNIFMTVGMVCWALIGSQGRYRLATSIATGCSFVITIPLGAIMTVRLRIDLQGLTFAVVAGYTVTAAILSTLLLMSDWEMFSRLIQGKNALEEEEEDDDDDSSSSSSSLSSCEVVELKTQRAEVLSTTPVATPDATSMPPVSELNPPHRTESLPQFAGSSPKSSPFSSSVTPISSSSSVTLDPPRTPPRIRETSAKQLTPEQKQAKSLAKLRSLSKQHVDLALPGTPRSPFDPAHSPPRNYSPKDDASSPRVVKGRRKRIH